jgi:hypothetical protein
MTLYGVDGSTWNLMDRTSPVHLLGGMGGLHLPPATNRWATTARRSGRRWKDVVRDSREFTMTLRVGDADAPFRTGDEWRDLDSQFWRALSTDATARLVFNDQRELRFRLGDDNDHDYPKDPALYGKAVYSIQCVADRPEWLGGPQTSTFSFAPVDGSSYYGPVKGPPFVISAPSTSVTAAIVNLGDLPSYPVWRIVGPATSVAIGVGDDVIPIPFGLASGQQVVIDTENETITDGDGNTLWPQMGTATVSFAPVPPGGAVPIVIGMADSDATSRIEITLVPRYRRAW